MSNTSPVRRTSLLAAAAICAVLITLTGCAISPADTATGTPIPMGSISGRLHGGPNPIQSANVILWQTASNGYGGAAVQLASTTTDGYGGFSFTPGAYTYSNTCASGQFAYITATGGYTGSNTANSQSVQMAAIGSCSNFATTTQEGKIQIDMSEISTVAAGFALGNFITVNQNGGTGNQLVNISAPANNNAASPACTVTSNYITSCTAAGLAHAFANAANLVDAVHFDGTNATGLAYTTPPSNSSAIAPQALIDALGNALQACTNSIGGTATTTPCGKLFSYAVLNSNTYGAANSTPVDELSAIINISKSPTSNVTNIFNISSPVGFFTPSLSAAPSDWSIAIWYPSVVSGSTTPLTWPIGVALDAADDVYVLNQDIATTPTGSNLYAFTANGSSLYATTLNTSLCDPVNIAADGNGYLWYANHEASAGTCPGNLTGGATAGAYGFTAATGALKYTVGSALTGTSPSGVAIDRNNNLWVNRSSGSQSLYEIQPPYTALASTPKYFLTGMYGVGIDANQNVWGTTNTISGTNAQIWGLPNQGLPSLPAWGTSSANAFATTALTLSTGSPYNASFPAFDAAGNVWVPSYQAVTKVVPVSTAAQSINITKYACSTCTLLEFYTGTQSFAVNEYIYVSGLSTTNGLTYDNKLWPVNSSGLATTDFKSTLCTTTCAVVASTTDTGTATLEPVASTYTASTTLTTNVSIPAFAEFDGTGTLWLDSNSSGGALEFVVPSTSVAITINPCYLPAAATACTGGLGYDGQLKIDSSGSIWTTSGTTASLIQIIGAAAPTWPLIAYGQPATKPQ